MEPISQTVGQKEIAISTEINEKDLIQVQNTYSSRITDENLTNSKTKNSLKSDQQKIKEYEITIQTMSQTILRLTKKNQQRKEEFRLLNEKLNKALTKLSPTKSKNPQIKTQDLSIDRQQLEKVKKELQNEMKKNKQLKKQVEILKQTQNLLNNEQKITQIKNQLAEKHREIKELKQKLKGYQRAEQSEKKMTYFRKEEQMSKKLHQLNEENIFLKKKIAQLKTRLEEIDKQKIIEKAEQAVQKNIKPKKTTDTLQWVKLEVHQQQIKKLQEQIKIYEGVKLTLEKTHRQEIDILKKHNQILSEEVDQLKFQIKKKNKEKFILEHRSQVISQMKNSRVSKDRSSVTIDVDDKNQRYKTFSLNLKGQGQTLGSLRKQFLGLSYGNFGNDYKKHDDSTRLDQSKPYTISSLKFKYFQEHILSLKVKYKYNEGTQVEFQTFEIDHYYTNTKSVQLIFQQHEYIKQLDIYCGKMIEFIQIVTSRNRQLQVGNEKNQVKCKKYSFDIKSHEKPVAFGSITQVKKTGDNKKQCLVVLGLITKKKDISINKKRFLQSPSVVTKQKEQVHQTDGVTHSSSSKQKKEKPKQQKYNKSIDKLKQNLTKA